jgi:hypothetical protein
MNYVATYRTICGRIDHFAQIETPVRQAARASAKVIGSQSMGTTLGQGAARAMGGALAIP